MAEANSSSGEKLEALLEQGKITQEEYDTLRDAMEAREETGAREPMATRPPRLGKSWTHRQLGGVCGGIADHLGIAPWRVRLIFLIAFVFSAGAALIVYFGLYLLLPWNEESRPLVKRFPWGYAIPVGVLTLSHVVLVRHYAMHLVPLFEGSAVELPLPTRLLLTMPDSVSFAFVAYFVLPTTLVAIYMMLPQRGRARRIFAMTTLIGLALVVCASALALFLPIFAMSGSI